MQLCIYVEVVETGTAAFKNTHRKRENMIVLSMENELKKQNHVLNIVIKALSVEHLVSFC